MSELEVPDDVLVRQIRIVELERLLNAAGVDGTIDEMRARVRRRITELGGDDGDY